MSSSTLRLNAIDVWGFARFIATGITATIGNIGAIWFVSRYASFEFSLLAGTAAGLLLSFTLSKLVAFRSRSWGWAPARHSDSWSCTGGEP